MTATNGFARPRKQRGAAAVEFALVVPVLLLLVFGAIQYGLYFWATQGGASAARGAARAAAVGRPVPCADFRDLVSSEIDGLGASNVSILRDFDSDATVTAGDQVTVTVSFDSIDLGLPIVPFIDDGQVSSAATARVENVPDSSISDCT